MRLTLAQPQTDDNTVKVDLMEESTRNLIKSFKDLKIDVENVRQTNNFTTEKLQDPINQARQLIEDVTEDTE